MSDAESPTRIRGVRFDLTLDRQVQELAARKYSTPSAIIRQAVSEFAQRERRTQRRLEHADRAVGADE